MESVCSGFMFRTRSWRAAKDGGYEAGLKSNVVAARPTPAFRLSSPVGPGTRDMEATLKCRSCRTPQYSPPAHLIKLTENREIAPYAWVNADDDYNATLSEIGVLQHCSKHCLSTAWSIAQASARDKFVAIAIFDCANPIDFDEHMSVADTKHET